MESDGHPVSLGVIRTIHAAVTDETGRVFHLGVIAGGKRHQRLASRIRIWRWNRRVKRRLKAGEG